MFNNKMNRLLSAGLLRSLTTRFSVFQAENDVQRIRWIPFSTSMNGMNTAQRHEWIATVKGEVNRFDPSVPIESAITPPASWYINPSFLELEMETVFRNNWIAVGHVGQVARKGQFITGTIGKEPYIVTRDQNDDLQAFFNVCRHHASVILEEECGEASQFVCRYHGWTYALDGRLAKAKRLKNIRDFKPRDYGLKKIAVQTFGPVIFLKLNEKVDVNLSSELEELKASLDEAGSENSLRWVKRAEFDLDCNWKVLVDNFLDGGYHIEECHPKLDSILVSNSYKTTCSGLFSIQSSMGTGERHGNNAIYAHIYPNCMINRYGDWMDTNYIFPVGQEKCRVVYDWFLSERVFSELSEEEVEEKIKSDLENSCLVQIEDNEICARVQKGLYSRSYQYGRYAPLVEMAQHEFHRKLYSDYGLELD